MSKSIRLSGMRCRGVPVGIGAEHGGDPSLPMAFYVRPIIYLSFLDKFDR